MQTSLLRAAALSSALLLLACGNDSTPDNPTDPTIVGAKAEVLSIHLRVGASAATDIASSSFLADTQGALYSISPDLPAGLQLNPQSGEIHGTPGAPLETTRFSITALTATQPTTVDIDIGIGPSLPPAIEFLASGYNAEVIVEDAAVPVRLAITPDGRLLYNELLTGNIRLVDNQSRLQETPYASIPITSGMEKGLLGLAIDPDFIANGYVYVYATVAGHSNTEPHAEIVRFTDANDSAVDKTIIIDNLPIADIHNGGDLVFDHAGHLFVGRGDIGDPSSAQTDESLSGKVLRYTKNGGIPADNPYPGSPEWVRGVRNTFALALQPDTGELFGADAGPESDDKLNYLRAGKNFVWGMEQEPQGSSIGFSIKVWPEVISPTALMFHSGAGQWESSTNHLLLASYNAGDVRWLVLAGEAYTDLIREESFLRFNTDGINNKPLHMAESADGSVYVSTLDAIYRIEKH